VSSKGIEDSVKLQTAKDRFHPPEFYVFVQQGPSVIGGQNNISKISCQNRAE
jgi:hypothetical protein